MICEHSIISTIVQGPDFLPETLVPLIEQIVAVNDLKETDSFDVAVADTIPVPPTETVGAVPKVMVWLFFSETMIC